MKASEILAVANAMPAVSFFSCFKNYHHFTRSFSLDLTLDILITTLNGLQLEFKEDKELLDS